MHTLLLRYFRDHAVQQWIENRYSKICCKSFPPNRTGNLTEAFFRRVAEERFNKFTLFFIFMQQFTHANLPLYQYVKVLITVIIYDLIWLYWNSVFGGGLTIIIILSSKHFYRRSKNITVMGYKYSPISSCGTTLYKVYKN